MAFTPNPKQTLVLQNLLRTDGRSARTKIKPKLDDTALGELADAQLVKIVAHGKGKTVVLNEEMARARFGDCLDFSAYKSRRSADIRGPFTPNPNQALVLWHLLLTGEKLSRGDIRPVLTASEFRALEKARLVEIDVSDPDKNVLLNDENAWAYLGEHLDLPVHESHSPAGNRVLYELLKRLQSNLPQLGLALAELLGSHPRPQPELRTSPKVPDEPQLSSLEERIRKACLAEAGGELHRRVRLSHLRKRLAPASRAEVDAALLRMQQAERLVLYPLDNPRECFPADEEAAIVVADQKQHILYLVK